MTKNASLTRLEAIELIQGCLRQHGRGVAYPTFSHWTTAHAPPHPATLMTALGIQYWNGIIRAVPPPVRRS